MMPGTYQAKAPLARRFKSAAAAYQFNSQLAKAMRPTPVTTRYLVGGELADALAAMKPAVPVPGPFAG
jgi:hypothetical protein